MGFSTTARVLGTAAAVLLAGCGGASTTAPTGAGKGAGHSDASAAGAATATVASATVAAHGAVLVAASNSMTLYTFANDSPGSGTSACTGACITRWPALTVPAGSSPVSKVGGTWGTIVRGDGGGTQVTYNGLPLYFFSGDTKPGDANGNYPSWSVVSAAAASGGATPTSSSSGNGVPGY